MLQAGRNDRKDYNRRRKGRQQENGILQEEQHPEGVLRATKAGEIRKEPEMNESALLIKAAFQNDSMISRSYSLTINARLRYKI
ncbi:hypothetical protein ES703_46409 [subsurface metagenome]